MYCISMHDSVKLRLIVYIVYSNPLCIVNVVHVLHKHATDLFIVVVKTCFFSYSLYMYLNTCVFYFSLKWKSKQLHVIN